MQSKAILRNPTPHPWKISHSKDQNLRLSWGNFYGNKLNFFVRTATNWNHLSGDQVEAPTLPDFKWLIATASTI